MCATCPDNRISLSQQRTGKQIEGVPEWETTLTTDCSCRQERIALTCNKFAPKKRPDPKILVQDRLVCYITPAVAPNAPVTFYYANSTSFDFRLLASFAAC